MADALGCDGWEISAHRGSAPDHEDIQGRQFTDKEFRELNNSPKRRRIGTLNCGHSAMGIIMGINEPQYTPEELAQMKRENAEGINYDGKHYTLYEATQRQRGLERTLRKQKRKILIDEKTGDKEKLTADQIRYVIADDEYHRFSKAAGLPLQHERANVPGFGAKQHRAAEAGYKKRAAEVGESAVTQNWHAIPVAGGQTETKYRRIKPDSIDTDNANAIIDANVKNTNPAHKNGGPAYGQNCQRCVAAYEMRRRGYDVIAKPAVVDENGLLSRRDPLYFQWGKVFSNTKFLRCPGSDGGMANIIERMELWGNGAVAEVKVQWDAASAHVFVAERVNGVVRFVDPQTGDTNCERYFTRAVNGATIVARIDNLEPTELIEKCIKNRGGKQ